METNYCSAKKWIGKSDTRKDGNYVINYDSKAANVVGQLFVMEIATTF